MSNQLSIYNFPDAYSTLVSGYTGTVKYVSSSGSNSNTGDSVSSPYLTIDYALTSNPSNPRMMIVVLAGTYTMTAVSGGNDTSVAIRDGGNERVYVCCPSLTVIQWTASNANRDCSMVDFQNTASAIYGGILKRNNNARAGSYVVAYFKMTTKGNLYNCVLQETNANNSWSYQYDNYGYNNLAVRNCTIYNGAAPSGNYSNAGTCLTIDTVFNTTVTTGGTETNVLKSQTVNATTYVTAGVTTAGVYSGTYAWNGTRTTPIGIYASPTSIGFGSSVVFTLYTANTGNIPYTISGVTSQLINNASLTGNFVVSGGIANVTITSTNMVTPNSYTITMTADGTSANVALSPNVSITTSVIGVGYPTNTASFSNPVTSLQMGIAESVVTVTDVTLGTKALLPKFADMRSNVSVSYTTMTTEIAGPIDQGVIKLFGDIPNREFWM